MTCQEAQEIITALVDHELVNGERVRLEQHLAECADCRLALDDEQTVKNYLKDARVQLHVPELLRARILADRRFFPEPSPAKSWFNIFWPEQVHTRRTWAAAFALILLVPIFYFVKGRRSVSLEAVHTYELFRHNELTLVATTPEEIENQLKNTAAERIRPLPYDLSALGLRPVAGTVREMNGRKVRVTVYQGNGRSLLCYTFQGTENDAPANAAIFYDATKRLNFFAYSSGSINAVLHRQGDVICILVSEMPMDELLALSRKRASAG